MKDENAVALGRKGGKVVSARKRAAIEANLRVAREKRWPKNATANPNPERTVERGEYAQD
jgi:hypothetical protein